MAPRPTHSRQQSKVVEYCDSVHTLVLGSPTNSLYAEGTAGTKLVQEITRRTQNDAPKKSRSNPLRIIVRAIAAVRSPKLRTPIKESPSSTSSKSVAALSAPETVAIRQLLAAPPSDDSLDMRGIVSAPTAMSSLRSRSSASSYHTALSRQSTTPNWSFPATSPPVWTGSSKTLVHSASYR